MQYGRMRNSKVLEMVLAALACTDPHLVPQLLSCMRTQSYLRDTTESQLTWILRSLLQVLQSQLYRWSLLVMIFFRILTFKALFIYFYLKSQPPKNIPRRWLIPTDPYILWGALHLTDREHQDTERLGVLCQPKLWLSGTRRQESWPRIKWPTMEGCSSQLPSWCSLEK